ncbi:diguanylate cyclase domain-containing protein [Lactobacillus sp.]|uniref:diguanylate cyclase domain-containing protein n=1 Tax=Lactobacillus sp. TaxID=1591 RepID=UPI003F11E2B1
MQKFSTRLLVIRRRFANFANTTAIVLVIFTVALAAIETRSRDFIADDGKFYLLDGKYLLAHLLIAGLLTALLVLLRYFLQRQKQLEYMSSRDDLTTLLNRAAFDDRVNDYLRQHPAAQGSFVMLDIDNFKLINDVHGHNVGDQVLVTLALNMESTLGSEAIICRNGGDEFCAFVPGTSDDQVANLAKLDQVFSAKEQQYPFSISLGYVHYPQQAVSVADALAKADLALYVVKDDGKHGWREYNDAMTRTDRKQFGFTLREVADNLPVSFFICQAEGEREILFANQSLLDMLGFKGFADLIAFTAGKLLGLIYPSDRALLDLVAGEDARRVPDRPRCLSCRLLTKDGGCEKVFSKTRLVEDARYGKVFYITLSLQNDYKILKEN